MNLSSVKIGMITAGAIFFPCTIVVCLLMIILILIRIRPLKSNSTVLLTLNTYFTCFLASGIMLTMCLYSLYGSLNLSSNGDDSWCIYRAYLSHVAYSAIFYSFTLQAIFRLFQTIFYRQKNLQNFRACTIAVIIQWFLAFLLMLPSLVLNDFQYSSIENNCWISFQNIRGLVMCLFIVYNIPLSIIFVIYTQIILYTRRTSHIQNNRISVNQRNVVVLKRIMSLMFIVINIGLPTVIVIFINFATKHTIPYSNDIQGLTISAGIFIVSLSLTSITPQLKGILRRRSAIVHPQQTAVVVMIRSLPAHST